MLRYLPFLLILAVWIYAFVDCLNTPEKEVRKLPKVMWVIIILLFGQVLLGPIAWFAAGRPRRNAPYGATQPQERRWVAPDDNPDFLNSLGKDRGAGPAADGGARTDPADGTAADAEAGRADASAADAAPETGGGKNSGGKSGGKERPAARKGSGKDEDEAHLRRWEDDLRRREEDLRRRESGGEADTPPAG